MIDPIQLNDSDASGGNVEWIGIRPQRRSPVEAVASVEARAELGLSGDHFAGKSGSDRQVTLVQHEHLAAIASILHRDVPDPGLLRRNIVVSGINLLALVGRHFRIGEAILEGRGPCNPCSRMEENLGPGGRNAMHGHGGITARVIRSGMIRVGDEVVDMGDVSREVEDRRG